MKRMMIAVSIIMAMLISTVIFTAGTDNIGDLVPHILPTDSANQIISKLNGGTYKSIEELSEDELKEIAEVNRVIQELAATPRFKKASQEDKEEMIDSLLFSLALEGTKKYPYSLIKGNSIMNNGSGIYGFEHRCGALGSVTVN